MDWDDLRYFAELSRCGSLSAAARQLKVDHSTVGRRVAALEESLDVRLFDRLAHGWVLTPAGQQVAERLQVVEQELFALASFARGQGATLSGVVRITAPPALAAHFLAPRLGGMRSTHPQVEIELIGEIRNSNLTRREADLALRLGRPSEASLIGRRMPDCTFGLYGSRAYLESRRPSDWTLIGWDDVLEQSPQQQWLRRYADGRPVGVRSNDLAIQLAAVEAGYGVAVLPHFIAHDRGDLMCIERGDPLLRRELWLLVQSDVRRSPAVRAVMDLLVAALERDRSILEGAG